MFSLPEMGPCEGSSQTASGAKCAMIPSTSNADQASSSARTTSSAVIEPPRWRGQHASPSLPERLQDRQRVEVLDVLDELVAASPRQHDVAIGIGATGLQRHLGPRSDDEQ